ncbi:MAG: MaoC family dehydratase N-terminal domain-containing protein [Actinomycetota bacterium]|nr:MaoC family dehydratase N-terminal domain-containing protein [Actinomycetota bacterium]
MADKSIIGADLGATTFPVERGKIREFANAILDDNPVYQGDDPVAPPTFTMTTAFWPRSSDTPLPDLGLNYARVLHGEQEFEYLKPLKPGDTLTGRTKISDVYEKEGKRGGTMKFIVSETSFTNQDGDTAIIARQVLVETSKAAS